MATDTHITSTPAPLTVEQLRALMGEAVERLLAALDALDAPDEDMEPYLAGSPHGCPLDAEGDHSGGVADDEPSLGAPERFIPRIGQELWADGGDPDRWSVDREIDGDESEPSLGSVAMSEHGSQECWSAGNDDDTEDGHDGREPDTDEELELGSTTCMNQTHAWAASRVWWGVNDGEPSLGWTGHGHGHPELALRGYDDDKEDNIDDRGHDDDELDGHGYDDVEPMGDLAGGCFRGQYRPSVDAIGDSDVGVGPSGFATYRRSPRA